MSQALLSSQTLQLCPEWALSTATFVSLAAVVSQGQALTAACGHALIPKGLVPQAHAAGSPAQCLPHTPSSAPCRRACVRACVRTLGLSAAAAGSRRRVGSACGTAGSAARGAGGCCWAGRGPCTARTAPSPVPRCTCRRRRGVQRGHHKGLSTPSGHTPLSSSPRWHVVAHALIPSPVCGPTWAHPPDHHCRSANPCRAARLHSCQPHGDDVLTPERKSAVWPSTLLGSAKMFLLSKTFL